MSYFILILVKKYFKQNREISCDAVSE